MRVFGASAMAVVLFSAAAANAQPVQPHASALYGELGYTWARISGSGPTAKPGVLRGIVGYDFHPNLAVEGMLGVGVSDDKQTILGTDVTSKVQHTLGVYLKPKVNPMPNLELFGRLGYADTRVKSSSAGGSFNETRGDWSYGAGVNYSFGKVYTGLDYMRYFHKDGMKADGVTLSVGYRF